MKWLDTTEHGFQVIPNKLTSGKVALMLYGPAATAQSPFAKDFSELKFKFLNGLWLSLAYSNPDGGMKIDIPAFRSHFPKLTIKEMSMAEAQTFQFALQPNNTNEIEDAKTKESASAPPQKVLDKTAAPKENVPPKAVNITLDNLLPGVKKPSQDPESEYTAASGELSDWIFTIKRDYPNHIKGDDVYRTQALAKAAMKKIDDETKHLVRRTDGKEWYIRPQDSCIIVAMKPIELGEINPKKVYFEVEDKGSSVEFNYRSNVTERYETKTFSSLSNVMEWLKHDGLKEEDKKNQAMVEQRVKEFSKQAKENLARENQEKEKLHGLTIDELICKDVLFAKEAVAAARLAGDNNLIYSTEDNLRTMRKVVGEVESMLKESINSNEFDFNACPKSYPLVMVELMRIDQENKSGVIKLKTPDSYDPGLSEEDNEACYALQQIGLSGVHQAFIKLDSFVLARKNFTNEALGEKITNYMTKDEFKTWKTLQRAISISGHSVEDALSISVKPNESYMSSQEQAAEKLLKTAGLDRIQMKINEMDSEVHQRMKDTKRQFGSNPWDYMTDAELETHHVLDIALKMAMDLENNTARNNEASSSTGQRLALN